MIRWWSCSINIQMNPEKPGFDEFTGNGILNVGRIENRNVPNLHDGAIVGYFDPEEMKGGPLHFLYLFKIRGLPGLTI